MAINRQKGILEDVGLNSEEMPSKLILPQSAIRDADCIVTAMLLGLCREYVGEKKEIIFTVEHPTERQEISTYRNRRDYQRTEDLERLIQTIARVNSALESLELNSLPKVKYGYAPWWAQGAYITGKAHGKGLPASLMKDGVTLVGDVPDEVGEEATDPDQRIQYTGRGAYTGVHIVDRKRMFLGSTFRHEVENSPADRWTPELAEYDNTDQDPEKSTNPWGMILGKSLQGDGMLELEHSAGTGVVGYTHGMIQAIYSAAVAGFKGQTIEVAVGDRTTKMASCFACTTFMCAAGRPPDAIHLGRGESWMPIYAKTPGSRHLHSCIKAHDAGCKQTDVDAAVTHMNKKWHLKCASWLYWGSKIKEECVTADHVRAWKRLVKFTRNLDRKRDNGKSANLFLDALTIHDSDSRRVDRTLK